ncbi:MAG: glucose-6-phosphate isomerase [Desulfobulbaceae bacterium DB1]|nr:MAG: glucose-6-phosphate isomerase [Desulfobulbaceae bacterium DB1]
MHTTNFDQLSAFAPLRQFSLSPYDLRKPGALNRQRINRYVCSSCGFDLLFATQRLDDAVLDALQGLADEAGLVEQFMAMKKGAVMNRIEGFPCENRQVLHTATRDVFSDPPLEPHASAQARQELAKLERFLADLDQGRIVNSRGESFTDMVQVGIGGSDLGPRALYHALAAFQKKERRVHFISNVDPDDAAAVLNGLDLSRTLINVVSKSGTTLETLTNEELVRHAYGRAGLDPAVHFVAVTGEASPMDNPARYLRSFYMFDYIGGRYSATSMVGGVLLGFALGYEGFVDILRGAHEVDRAAEKKDIWENIPLLLALLGVWNHNFLGSETLAILPYSQGLIRFAAHLQQCDMESNGKSINRRGDALSHQSGPVIWGEPGTNGQHAFYQLIHQGTTVVPVEFVGFRQSQYEKDILIQGTTSQEKLVANLLAQSLALATGQDHENPNKRFPGNRPNSILLADRLTPRSMGSLLAIYENKIAFQGFVWNINSFDQEGVQLGKKLANQLLDHFAGRRADASYSGDAEDAGWAMLRIAGLAESAE